MRGYTQVVSPFLLRIQPPIYSSNILGVVAVHIISKAGSLERGRDQNLYGSVKFIQV